MNQYTFVGTLPIHTKTGVLVANNFTRIVHGGRGAYVEFDNVENTHIPDRERWRITSNKAYYIEHRTIDGVKVYYQKKTVGYADYKIGKWYISPVDLKDFKIINEF